MNMKKYKLGDLLFEFHAGKAIQTENIKNKGAYPVYGGNGQRGYTDSYNQNGEYLIIGRQGAYCGNVRYNIGKAYLTEHAIVGQAKENHNPIYIALKLSLMNLSQLQGQSAQPGLSVNTLSCISMEMPPKEIQDKIADIMLKLERKIELNRQINDNLEAMAKQLYDYWFVQLDFPNEEGKPYKSSGGAMVWNEDLHMSIPCNWNVCLLSDYIGCNNTGDWGFDEPAEKRSIKVGCIRGADIVKLNNLPIRYIKDNNTSKLLSAWDIVIEVSGGSPTQATGRSAFVTPGVLKRNGGNLTCSNFCHAFTMKDCKASAYFYFMWRMFYDNNNMFNFEGKTSGIKNFMTDTFLANKWLDVPTVLLDLFFERVKVIFEQIDNNIEEINALTKQRDELLPLLMNGQATVNYHLSVYFFRAFSYII
jgi:restriction endonuclease S subunit